MKNKKARALASNQVSDIEDKYAKKSVLHYLDVSNPEESFLEKVYPQIAEYYEKDKSELSKNEKVQLVNSTCRTII